MNTFAQIVAAFGVTAGNPVTIQGESGDVIVRYNAPAPGLGIIATLIIELNAGIHITIFQNSWDTQIPIQDFDGSMVNIGPYCLHLTAGADRWFRQNEDSNWIWVTDYDTPTARVVRVFELFFAILKDYLE